MFHICRFNQPQIKNNWKNFQKFLKWKTWICCTHNYLHNIYIVFAIIYILCIRHYKSSRDNLNHTGGYTLILGFPGGSDCKESACRVGDPGSIPVLGRSPGERNVNLLQYSCLENPMDRGAWWATVHRVARVRHDLPTKPAPHTYIHTYAYIQIHSYLHRSTYIKYDVKAVFPHSFIFLLLEAKPSLWKVCFN